MTKTISLNTSRLTLGVLIVLGMLLPTSCQDFLEKPLQGELTQESFPTTAEDALAATNAVYNITRSSSFHFGLFPIMDIMSDDAYKGSNPSDAASDVGPYDKFKHIPTEGNIKRWWNTLYEGVKRANVVIEKTPTIKMDETLRKRYIAEATFLRALFYFDLVRAWGGVPKVISVATQPGLKRASSDEIYELIIEDLLLAIPALSEKSEMSSTDLGRATRGAAKALLAKVYLFKKDFINAEKYALEVINSGQYGLEPIFNNASSQSGEHGIESVYEIGAMRFEGIENGGNSYGQIQGVRGTPNRGWGFNRPSLDLMAAFEPNDPRKEATILFLNEVIDGVTIAGDGTTPDETKDANGNVIEIECYNQKVWTPGSTVPDQFGHNRRIIRYADVLLFAAEAMNENAKSAQALIYLNQVRARARGGNPAILLDISDTNKDTLRDKIFKERRVELALEGHRFWDVVRFDKAQQILSPLGFIKGKHELLPLPQNEIDLSQKVLTQNANWN